MTNKSFIKSQTWRFVLIALFFIAAAFFTSCGSSNYSPLDSYVKATIKNAADSTKHANEMKEYLAQFDRDTTGRFCSPNASVLQYILDHRK